MPGYGYAKAAKSDVGKWQALLRGYLRGRPGLRRAFVLVDARHGPKAADEHIFALLDEAAVTYQIVLDQDRQGLAQGPRRIPSASPRPPPRRIPPPIPICM